MVKRPDRGALALIVLGVAVPLSVTGCGGSEGDSASVANGPATLRVSPSSPFDTAVAVDGDGLTLYRYDKDSANPPTSNCRDACAQRWLPLLVQGEVVVEGIAGETVGTTHRPDGAEQVTLGGWPLYTFTGDQRAGDFLGQASGGAWFAVAPDGTKATGISRTQ
jgi:predicted lipoprotein with Yx(FWY)xxD motif